jgi:hypothetical protein
MRIPFINRNGRDEPVQAAPPVLPPGGGAVIDPGNLLEVRRALAEIMAELQWDLGGLAYEMAIREHFRIDVLARRAARLQEVDAELGAVERLVRMEQTGSAGTCRRCGALHSRGAIFCEQCGNRLMDGTAPGAAPGADSYTDSEAVTIDEHWPPPDPDARVEPKPTARVRPL